MGTIHTLPNDRIEYLLRTAIVGRIACCAHGENGESTRPYLVPLAFGYNGSALYAHTGPGTKLRLMRANPLVSIEVDEATASDRWSSVVGEGRFEEIDEPSERLRALRTIYPEPTPIPNLGEMTVVFRIVLTGKTGRYEVPDTD